MVLRPSETRTYHVSLLRSDGSSSKKLTNNSNSFFLLAHKRVSPLLCHSGMRYQKEKMPKAVENHTHTYAFMGLIEF